MIYGRIDAQSPEDCAPEGNLPGHYIFVMY